MIARILIDASIASDPRLAAAVATQQADLFAEGWSVSSAIVPTSAAVPDVHALIGTCDHLQIIGSIAVPRVWANPDGHGDREIDSDAPYATDDLTAWKPQPDGSYLQSAWPSDALRSVSRIDVTFIAADEAGAIASILGRNHAYRTGAFQYDGLGVMVDRFPGSMDASLRSRVNASLEAVVGPGNVTDATSQYLDDAFFQSYAGRTFLVGCLFSGGDPNRQPNGVFGHEYYVGTTADAAAGLCQIGFARIYCSYGEEFERWPFEHGLVLGGSLAVFWDPGCDTDMTAWDAGTPIGQALKRNHTKGSAYTYMIQGDASLCRREQDMGVSQATYDAGIAAVKAQCDAEIAGVQAQIATLQATVLSMQASGVTKTVPVEIRVNCGGSGAGLFAADAYFSGQGIAYPTPPTLLPAPVPAVINGAPISVYQTCRTSFTTFGYVFTGLAPGAKYTVRMHFAEPMPYGVGDRPISVAAQGAIVASGFDVVAAAGGPYRAITKDIQVQADQSGVISMVFSGDASAHDSHPFICGIEVLSD